MNDDSSQSSQGPEQWAAFQKIWADTFNKMLQLGVTFSPESAPPEFVRQMRSSIFQAMAQSWDEFLRSPQFLDGMKQWMESAIAFRQMSNDVLSRAHESAQTPGRNDVDAILQAIRHLEQRLGDKIEEIESRLPQAAAPKQRANGERRPARAKAAKSKPRPQRKRA
jgi:hypothetical protein